MKTVEEQVAELTKVVAKNAEAHDRLVESVDRFVANLPGVVLKVALDNAGTIQIAGLLAGPRAFKRRVKSLFTRRAKAVTAPAPAPASLVMFPPVPVTA